METGRPLLFFIILISFLTRTLFVDLETESKVDLGTRQKTDLEGGVEANLGS